jgi:hypothetical protein
MSNCLITNTTYLLNQSLKLAEPINLYCLFWHKKAIVFFLFCAKKGNYSYLVGKSAFPF